MKNTLPASARCAVKRIDELGAQKYASFEEYQSGLSKVTDEFKREVVHSQSEYDSTLPCFYISNSGDDDADGKTPETAWRTFRNINDPDKTFEGCNILFERGGIFRGKLTVPHSYMTFSAYGVGQKPRLYGSKVNYAHPKYWKESEYKNVWYTDFCTENVGMIAVDHSDVMGKYDEIMCRRHVVGLDGFEGPWQLEREFDFYANIDEPITYLYCEKGNPGEVYDSIELGEGYTLIEPGAGAVTDIVFDNLCIKFTGCHAIAGLHCRENVTVRNCVFCYLGGSILDGHAGTRIFGYGNAIETCQCRGYYIYGNWIYQIYDTAITHQCGAGEHPCHMADVRYVGNLCEYCHWSIEFYNIPKEGIDRQVYDNSIHHNILRMGGYGRGSRGRTEGAALFNSFGLTPKTYNFTAHSNIFDRSAGGLVRLNRGGDEKIGMFGNVYIQKKGGNLGWIFDGDKPFENAGKTIEELLSEERPTVFYGE